VYVKLTAAA